MTRHLDLRIPALLDELASEEPTPGGGTAQALGAALGAALVGMLARLSLGRPRYADHAELLGAIAEEADAARDRLLALSAEDAAAYDAVTEARGLPHDTEEARTRRQEAIRTTLKRAIETPLRVMEQCVEVIGLAKNAIEYGNKNAAADGATGAELCRAALKGAAMNVKANLQDLDDEAYARVTRTRMDEMLYMGTRVCTNVESYVEDLWK